MKKINPNTKLSDGNTGFHYACAYNAVDVVELFIKTDKVDLNAKNEKGETGFHFACRLGQFLIVDLLLNTKRVNVNEVNNNNETGFFQACAPIIEEEENKKALQVVKLLLISDKIRVDIPNRKGVDVLSQVICSKNEDLLKWMLLSERFDNFHYENLKDMEGNPFQKHNSPKLYNLLVTYTMEKAKARKEIFKGLRISGTFFLKKKKSLKSIKI